MKYVFAFLLAAITVTPAFSQNLGLGVRAGTTGAGVEVALGIHPKINLRGHFSTFAYDYSGETTDESPNLQLDATAAIGAYSGFIDIHPFSNAFRLTGGVGKNNFDVSATGTALDAVCLGDEDAGGNCSGKVFSPEKLGSLGVSVAYASSLHPYVGLGFGSLGNGTSRIMLLLDLGVYYTGAPEIEMENDGLFKPTTEPENVQALNDGIESFAWYPVLSLGIGIRL